MLCFHQIHKPKAKNMFPSSSISPFVINGTIIFSIKKEFIVHSEKIVYSPMTFFKSFFYWAKKTILYKVILNWWKCKALLHDTQVDIAYYIDIQRPKDRQLLLHFFLMADNKEQNRQHYPIISD